MKRDFIRRLYRSHKDAKYIPSTQEISDLGNSLIELLFPELASNRYPNLRSFELQVQAVRHQLYTLLDKLSEELPSPAQILESAIMEEMPALYETLLLDASSMCQGDPAAENIGEVIRTYPGFYAVAVYRLAHIFHQKKIPFIPRLLTEHAHSRTGIDIHPGAQIGKEFCIDHGTGIVIGETVVIGDRVKIYQGVTLGALSVAKEMAKTKRHPTIENNAVIYANATILGGDTTIGHHSIIGGNVWITRSVAPYAQVYYKAEGKIQSVIVDKD